MSKSTSTFIRRQLKIKGSTEHNGRGVWEMYMSEELTYDEVLSRINAKIDTWQEKGYVDKIEDSVDSNGERHIMITFSPLVFDKSYRSFYTCENMVKHGVLGGITFTCDMSLFN